MGSFLKKVNNVYYYWRRIPSDIANMHNSDKVNKSHIKHTLKERKKQRAQVKAAIITIWLDKYFSLLRTGCYTEHELEKVLSSAPIDIFCIKKNAKQKKVKACENILELYQLYEVEKLRSNSWREKTKKDQQQMIRLLVELIGGNKTINRINRRELLQVRESICKLPPNLMKVKKFKGKSLTEVLSMEDYSPMSSTRSYRIISHLRTFFLWAFTHGFIETDISSGLMLTKKRKIRQNEERKAYSNDDLAKLFTTEVFKGNTTLDRPENFFIPIIAMHTGMRLNEICQLYVEDIMEKDGIHYFSINDLKDKKVKNPQSIRLVPIHPTLIDIGLLEYVAKIRNAGFPRLWMKLTYREDSYAKQFSSFFQRLNRKYITQDKKKVFHSFRHGFTSQLKEKGARSEIISELLGHSHGSITLDRYGKAYTLSTLKEVVDILDYSVPLEQLKTTAKIITSKG